MVLFSPLQRSAFMQLSQSFISQVRYLHDEHSGVSDEVPNSLVNMLIAGSIQFIKNVIKTVRTITSHDAGLICQYLATLFTNAESSY